MLSYGSNNGFLFATESKRESVENRKLRFIIADLLEAARTRTDEEVVEHYATFEHEMTIGQTIKLRDNKCRIWMKDRESQTWYHYDVDAGELIKVYK